MLLGMKLKLVFFGGVLAAPWLISASSGPVVSLGAWIAASLILVAVLFSDGLRFLPHGLVIAAAVSLFIGFFQFLGWAVESLPWVATATAGEMMGNLRQRNQLATLLSMGLLSLLAWRHLKHAVLPWLVLLAMLLSLGNALSGSRTGLLQWGAVACCAWFLRHSLSKAQLWLLCAMVVGYVLGVLLAPWLAEMAGHTNLGLLGRVEDGNAFSRIALWGNVIELIAQKPWLGHGWGGLAYAHYSTEFSGTRFMELLDNAHNLPLHLAVTLGLPVALAFCAFVLCAVIKLKPWREANPERLMAWGMLLVIGIHSMLEYPLWYGPFFMTAVLCIGILCSDLWRNWLLAGTESARAAIILGVRGLGVALLALTAFAAFDYHRVSQIYLQPEYRSSWYADDALGAAQKSVLFKSHAKFAELVITPLSRETATRVLALSSELVEWSPEPRVIEKLIESSVMLGVDDLAAFHIKRYKVAYPQAYAAWAARSGQLPS
jgi:O-antigen ligase